MAEIQLNKIPTLEQRVDDFLSDWHKFPFDYWWRKKYNIPFGSSKHREMNFIDMFIEWREEKEILKAIDKLDRDDEERENEELGLSVENSRTIKMSSKEIDEDYENLDLTNIKI